MEDTYELVKTGALKVIFRGIWASPAEHRFWACVDKNGPTHPTCGQCWKWIGGKHDLKDGYGKIMVRGKRMRAHVYSWQLHYGEIQDSLHVLHHCDNPECVRPEHLFLGTQKDNSDDMIRKGRDRKACGEENVNAKLTDAAVRDIRRRYVRGSARLGQVALAQEYGVSQLLISLVVRGKVWRHVQ